MAQFLSFIPRKPKERSTALVPRPAAVLATTAIGAFESEVAATIVDTTPYSEHVILHSVVGFIVVSVVLAAVIKTDTMVTSTGGMIATTQGPIFVQPYSQGIVHQIMVKAGDIVKKGQVLATLDPTFTAADETQLRDHLASDQAKVDRLEAEQAGRPFAPKSDGKYELLQLAQWQQRQEEYRHTLAGYDAQVKGAQALLKQAQLDVAILTERLTADRDIEVMRQKLEASGWGASLLTNQAKDARADVARQLADAKQQIEVQTHTIENLTSQHKVYAETWQDYIANDLVTTRNDLEQTSQALAKAAKLHDLITLTSPADAVVLHIGTASVGSVVDTNMPNAGSGQAQPLITLTPLGDKTQAQLEIDTGDVAFIRVGDPVTLKVDAFDYLRFGSADGVVKTISEGSFTQEDNGAIRSPFYKVWVEITRLNFHNVPENARLIPGMTVSGNIRVGRRTVLSYLTDGVLKNMDEAMREP